MSDATAGRAMGRALTGWWGATWPFVRGGIAFVATALLRSKQTHTHTHLGRRQIKRVCAGVLGHRHSREARGVPLVDRRRVQGRRPICAATLTSARTRTLAHIPTTHTLHPPRALSHTLARTQPQCNHASPSLPAATTPSAPAAGCRISAVGSHSHRARVGSPLPHLFRAWAHPCHICTGTGLAPLPHLPPNWACLRFRRASGSRA
jgi:hypothetical protein